MKVLLVEDDSALADVLARNLRVRGHKVDVKATAEDAIFSMAEDWPQAIIVDINLSGEHSGWEILRRLSEQERSRVKVIVTSAAPFSEKRICEFRPAHALQKPFPIDALVSALEDTSEADAPPAGIIA